MSVLIAHSHQSVAPRIHRNMCFGGKMSHSTNTQLASPTQSTMKTWKSERSTEPLHRNKSHTLPVLHIVKGKLGFPGRGPGSASEMVWCRCAQLLILTVFIESVQFQRSGLASNWKAGRKVEDPLVSNRMSLTESLLDTSS